MATKVGKILGGGTKPKTPKLPPVEPPKTMPVPDDQAIKLAKARELAYRMKGKGSRQETILTQDDGQL